MGALLINNQLANRIKNVRVEGAPAWPAPHQREK